VLVLYASGYGPQEVCQSLSVVLTVLVSCADCVDLSALFQSRSHLGGIASGYYEPIRLPERQVSLLVVAPPFLLALVVSAAGLSGLLGSVRLLRRRARS